VRRFVVLLSAVVDHGGMNGKETAMDAARRGKEAHTCTPARNSYSGSIQILKVRICAIFTEH
jgi:hypothetical protein